MKNYQEFLSRKEQFHHGSGIEVDGSKLNSSLFPFQAALVQWALFKGKAAIFANTGLGKTIMQLEWAKHIPGDVIILAPLAVSEQTVREGKKFGIEVTHCFEEKDVKPGINITNYERLHKFDVSGFNGVVIDESSCLKSYTSKYRNFIIESFSQTPYKLACTATPAPNDFMELGNHCEFLDVRSRTEMLAEFFINDLSTTQKWRLKGHAIAPFWKWVTSWAINIRKPSDIGFDDEGFDLLPLNIHEEIISADYQEQGYLFPMMASTLKERQQARKKTTSKRAERVAEIIATKPNEPWIVWCNLNDEADAITKAVPNAVEIRGSDKPERKSQGMLDFSDGKIQVLVTKPSIAGHGMNWQHCSNVVFCGLSDSWEQYYQAIRRCWRFGQTKPVDVYVVISDVEGAVVQNIKRKEADALEMADSMISQMSKESLNGYCSK